MKLLRILALLLFSTIAFAQQPPATDTVKLLTAAAATGSQLLWPGGIGIFQCVGTYNGATVTLQALGPDGTTLETLGVNTTLNATNPTPGGFYWPRANIIATVSGAGGSTSLTCTAVVIRTLVQ